MGRRNVVVTGWAATTPLGNDVEQIIERCYTGQAGFRPISLFETKGSSMRFAGEHEAPDGKLLPDRKFAKVLSRRDQTSVLTTLRAATAAGLKKGDIPADRIGLFVGASCTHLGDLTPYLPLVERCADLKTGTFDSDRFGIEFMDAFNPLIVLKLLMNNALCYGTISLDIQGVNSNYMQGEVSGLRAVGEGFLAIAEGRADVVIAGGTSGQVEPFQMFEAKHFGLLADQSGASFDPAKAVKPYDKSAGGTVLSEGAAFVVLEDEEHARRRGAAVLGRIVGFAVASDGEPDDEAPSTASSGLVRATANALRGANLEARHLGFVIGNGSGNPVADRREALAYVEALGNLAAKVPVASLKGVFGEMAEAGGVANLFCALAALRRGLAPPTINFQTAEPSISSLCISAKAQTVSASLAAAVSRSRFGVSAVALVAPP